MNALRCSISTPRSARVLHSLLLAHCSITPLSQFSENPLPRFQFTRALALPIDRSIDKLKLAVRLV